MATGDNSQVFYHSSIELFKPGQDLLPLRKHQPISKDQKTAEEIFEQVRRVEFPIRPSRLDSIFVAPSPKHTVGVAYDVYQVSVKGRTFITDQELYTDATKAPSENEITQLAREYWQGNPLARLPEILVEGKVKVLQKVTR